MRHLINKSQLRWLIACLWKRATHSTRQLISITHTQDDNANRVSASRILKAENTNLRRNKREQKIYDKKVFDGRFFFFVNTVLSDKILSINIWRDFFFVCFSSSESMKHTDFFAQRTNIWREEGISAHYEIFRQYEEDIDNLVDKKKIFKNISGKRRRREEEGGGRYWNSIQYYITEMSKM